MARNDLGCFSRQEALALVKKSGFKGKRPYEEFKGMIESGFIIPVSYRLYRLSDDVSRALVLAIPEVEVKKVSSKDVADMAIAYLNEKTGKKFRVTPKVVTLVNTRCSEGFRIEDFKSCIDIKFKDWVGTEWARFLRPETLFGNKMNGYCNQLEGKNKTERIEEYDFSKYFKRSS